MTPIGSTLKTGPFVPQKVLGYGKCGEQRPRSNLQRAGRHYLSLDQILQLGDIKITQERACFSVFQRVLLVENQSDGVLLLVSRIE